MEVFWKVVDSQEGGVVALQYIVERDVQSQKALLPIFVTELGIINSTRGEYPLNVRAPIFDILSPITTFVKLEPYSHQSEVSFAVNIKVLNNMCLRCYDKKKV